MAAIQGIELSRRFYAEIVAPWLEREAPSLSYAAGLIGYGSELLGFDDEMSRDHDFTPRVQLFVSTEDFDRQAEGLVERFAAAAPGSFLGVRIAGGNPRHSQGARSDRRHGLEVWTLSRALEHWLAIDPDRPIDAVGWLALPEQRLLGVTAGAVFRDDAGELSGLRERMAYLPRDVWLYKLACQWRRIAEEQAFVGRTGFVGDELGSRVIAARLVRDVMRLGFLIERQYAPYPKWFGIGFGRLPCADELAPLLERTMMSAHWRDRESALAHAYLAAANLHLSRGLPGAFEPRLGSYFSRPFTVINADEIAAAIRAEIGDATLRDLPLIGSLDQVTDATPLAESPRRAQAAMRALLHHVEAGAVEEA